jgi:hypothetical protein
MNNIQEITNKFGLIAARSTFIITIITFVLAMIAIPISGANCPGDCVGYPYLDTLSQYPRDFIWMFAAMLMVLAYLALMASIHQYAREEKKIFSLMGLMLAAITAAVLLSDYFIQASVVPMSLMNAETDGLALLIQYNSHGVFLILEELGYILMALSFLFIALSFSRPDRLHSAIYWIFLLGFSIVMAVIVLIASIYGLERLDRLEVIILSIDWLVLIINGFLLSRMFKKELAG